MGRSYYFSLFYNEKRIYKYVDGNCVFFSITGLTRYTYDKFDSFKRNSLNLERVKKQTKNQLLLLIGSAKLDGAFVEE